jgi:hypothetical protein
VLYGEVVYFGGIGGQVVKFPGFLAERDKFPIAIVYAAIAFMLNDDLSWL